MKLQLGSWAASLISKSGEPVSSQWDSVLRSAGSSDLQVRSEKYRMKMERDNFLIPSCLSLEVYFQACQASVLFSFLF